MKHHKRPNEQNLFGIVQGGLDPELRWIYLNCSICLVRILFSSVNFFVFFYFAAGITYHCLSNQRIRDICVRGLVERNLPGYVHSFFCRITLIQQLKIMRTELLIYLSSFILDLPFYCYRPCAWSVFWTIEFIHGTWLNKFQVIPLLLTLQKK